MIVILSSEVELDDAGYRRLSRQLPVLQRHKPK